MIGASMDLHLLFGEATTIGGALLLHRILYFGEVTIQGGGYYTKRAFIRGNTVNCTPKRLLTYMLIRDILASRSQTLVL